MVNVKCALKWLIIGLILIVIWTFIVGIPIFLLILAEAVMVYEFHTSFGNSIESTLLGGALIWIIVTIIITFYVYSKYEKEKVGN